MSSWVIVVVAAIGFSCLHSMYKDHLKFRSRRVELADDEYLTAELADDLADSLSLVERQQQQLQRLADRIEALEAIVTDPRYQLAQEIDALAPADRSVVDGLPPERQH